MCGLPHLPPIRAHLVKPEAADRARGVLMITCSGCPLAPNPLTFLPEENSRWTAAVPQSGAFSSGLLSTRCVQKAGHVHDGDGGGGERGPRDALRLLPFPP